MRDGHSSRIKAFYCIALHKFRQDGIYRTLKSGIERLWRVPGAAENAFDRQFGTNTSGIVPLWKLHIESAHRAHGVRYQASDPDFVRAAIENLPVRPEKLVYIDIGSGKGLTLLVASEYPFRRVLGIEFSPELHSIAAENIRRHSNRRRKCEDVSSVLADAATYEFPTENMLLFLYNPFGEDILRRVLINLSASIAKTDREIYVVYSNPVFSQLLDGAAFLERLECPVNAAVYSHIPKE